MKLLLFKWNKSHTEPLEFKWNAQSLRGSDPVQPSFTPSTRKSHCTQLSVLTTWLSVSYSVHLFSMPIPDVLADHSLVDHPGHSIPSSFILSPTHNDRLITNTCNSDGKN